jgi:anaerobic carbon-monoxide dehydrogenase iron sulfur subunit
MAQLRALQIHPEKCTGCKQCELACSWVQVGQFQPARSLIRVQVYDEQASYAPYTCFQCDEAWCMHACPVNAIDVDEATGAKIVLDEVCVGCKLCVIACPFGTIFYDGAQDTAAKCDLCAGDPACAHACPTAAITVESADPGQWIAPFGESVDRHYRRAVEGDAG